MGGGGERYTGTSQNFIQPENGFLTQFNGKDVENYEECPGFSSR